MNEYKILFKVYDKKMQCNIKASTEKEAYQKLLKKVEIVKIKKVDQQVENLKKMFGMK